MMNSAVRGKSARTRSTTSATSAAPPPTSDRHPGRRRRAARPACAGRRPARVPSSRFGPYGVYSVNAVRSPRVVAASAVCDVAVARPVRVGVEQGVLVEASGAGRRRPGCRRARRAGPPRGGASSRTGRPGWPGIGRRAVGPDRQHDRRELALAELGLEPVEGGARRRRLGRQDRGVRGVEPDVQERRAEQEQEERGSG